MRNIDILLEMVLFQILFGKVCLRRAAIKDKSGRDLSVQVTADTTLTKCQWSTYSGRDRKYKSSLGI